MFQEKAIVFLDINGQVTPSVIVSGDANAVSVWLNDKQPQKVKLDRVLRVSRRKVSGLATTPVKAVAEAHGYLKTVYDAIAQVDLAGLWELLADEGGEYTLEELADFALPDRGEISIDAMALSLLEDKVYFRVAKAGFAPNPSRSVDEKRKQQLAASQAQQEEILVVETFRQLLAAPTPGAPLPDHLRKSIQLLREHALDGPDHVRGAKAAALLDKIDEGGSDSTWFRALDILVRLGVFREHENLDLVRHRIVDDFPSACLDDAQRVEQRLAQPGAYQAHRVDLRHIPFVAIDDADTRDVDDALTAEKLEHGEIQVMVAISDAAEYVDLESALGAEARRRASSLYLPDRIIPMLPPLLSENVVSLTPGKDQPVLCFSFIVQPDGTTHTFRVVEAIAHLHARLSYDEVDHELAEPKSSPYTTALVLLEDAALRLRQKRRKQGALLLRQPDFKVRVSPDGQVDIQKQPSDSRSRVLVSEMMVATCAQTADFCRWQGVPTVYRSQDAPEEGVDITPDQEDSPVAIHQVLRRMRRAEVSLQARDHFGLGVSAYTQVTSPIRRYQDLVMHAQIKGYLRSGHAPLGEKEILAVFAEVENIGALYSRIERDAKRYWTLHYLRGHISDTVSIVVLRDVGKRFLVELLDYGIQETISPSRTVAIGDRLTAHIAESLPRRDRLILRV